MVTPSRAGCGVGVCVGVGVAVGVKVAVGVGVSVAVGIRLRVGARVAAAMRVGVGAGSKKPHAVKRSDATKNPSKADTRMTNGAATCMLTSGEAEAGARDLEDVRRTTAQAPFEVLCSNINRRTVFRGESCT